MTTVGIDEVTEKIVLILQKHPYQSAKEISKSMGSLRKDVNSRLYSHLDVIFKKEGTDPPVWRLMEHQPLNDENSISKIIE